MNDAALQGVRERALEMRGEGRPLREILAYLGGEAEAISGGDAVCSVLLLDKDDAAVGTCAAAAAWSVPIVGAGGRVLGTFETHFRKNRMPRPEERMRVEALAQLARAFIEA